MNLQAALLADIESFIAQRGIAETTFGRRAVEDGKFVARLRAGANMTLRTMDKARAFMAAEAGKGPHRQPAPSVAA